MTIDPNNIQQRFQQLPALDQAELRLLQKDVLDLIMEHEATLCKTLRNMSNQLSSQQIAISEWVSAKSMLRKAVRGYKRSKAWNKIRSKFFGKNDTEESKNNLDKLAQIKQKRTEEEKSKRDAATEQMEMSTPNWRPRIQEVTKSMFVARKLESKLTKSALKYRIKADYKWINSVAKKATQGGIPTLLISAFIPMVGLLLVIAKETYYYNQFDFDIVPYMRHGSVLSASAAPIFQTILASFLLSFFGLVVLLSLSVLARLANLSIRSHYVLLKWRSTRTKTARRIEQKSQSTRQ